MNRQTIICQPHKGQHEVWWRWRSIDGRRCWYPGKAVVPKSQLTWEPPIRKYYTDEELLPPELSQPSVIVPEPPPNWGPRIDEAFTAVRLQPLPNTVKSVEAPKPAPTLMLSDLAPIGAMAVVILITHSLFRVLKKIGQVS